jgi:hypothetical protein
MIDDNPSMADPLGQIADEFVEAFRQGKRPSIEEFARRYPAHWMAFNSASWGSFVRGPIS